MKAKPSFNILLRVVLRVVRHPSGIAARAYRSGARHASDGSPMLRSSSSKNGARLCRSHARCPANGPAGPFGTAASPGNRKRAAASYTCNHPGRRLRGRSPADRRASVRADKPRNPHDIGSAGGRLRVFARRAGATGTGRRTPAPGRPCAEKPRGTALPAPDGAQAGRGSAGGNGPPETLRGPIPSAGRQAANPVRTRTRSSAAEQKNFDKNVRPIRRSTPSHRPRPCASSVRTVLTHAAAIRCIRVVAPSGKGTKQRLRDKPPLLSGSAYSEKIPRKRGRRGGKNKKRLSKTHQTASFGKRVPLISSRSDVFSSATDSNP